MQSFKRKGIILVVILGLLLLVGCSSDEAREVPTSVPLQTAVQAEAEPTATSVPIEPTATAVIPTVEPTATPSPTPEPTKEVVIRAELVFMMADT